MRKKSMKESGDAVLLNMRFKDAAGANRSDGVDRPDHKGPEWEN